MIARLRGSHGASPADMSTPQSRRIAVLIAGAAAVAAAVLAATAGLVWQSRQEAFQDATQSIEKINVVLAEHTGRTLQGIDLLLTDQVRAINARQMKSVEEFQDTLASAAVHQELRQRQSGLPQLDALNLVNRQGDVINTSRMFPSLTANVAARDYFVALSDDARGLTRFIGAPVQNRATGSWTIYVARRLNGPDGAFFGLVTGAVSLDHFEIFYQQIYFGDNTGVSLWRTDGTLLARYPQAAALTGKPNAKVLQNHMRVLGGESSQAGTARVLGAVNPTPLLLTVRRVPGYAFYTTISVPEAVVLATWRQTSAFIVAGGIVISIAIGVIAWLLMKQFAAHKLTVEARAQRDEATATLREVEAISRAKSEFLAHMVHELRTPLNAIIGFAELMKEELMGPLGSRQYKGYATDIHASGANLLGIVNDVLDFSQASAGRLSVERRPVELPTVIRATESMFRVEVGKAGLEFASEIAPALPRVLADEKRLRQVLINLVGNAIKFTQPGGSVRITAKAAGERVVIRVQDTGIGIPAENLGKLFEPFGEVKLPQLAQKSRGAGLGLPICKQLVELLGGTLTLESELGAGTTVTVELQIADAPQSQPGYAIAAE